MEKTSVTELDSLLEQLVEHLTKRTGFSRANTDRLVAAGLVKTVSRREGKRQVFITDAGHKRLHDLNVERTQAASIETLKKFINDLIFALPSALVVDAPEPWDTFAEYLRSYEESRHFFVSDLGTGDRLKVSIRERHSRTPYSGLQEIPLGQWDITVGDWTDCKKFRSRKSGMPLTEVVAEIKRLLAKLKAERAAEVTAVARRYTVEERVEALHQELGRVKNDILAHLVVEPNGELRLQLPRRFSFEQAEALLRAAKKVGL